MEKLKYRVYEAKLLNEDTLIKFCVSSVRETSFREEIRAKRFLIDETSMKILHETEDRNEARAMATEF